MGTMLMGHFEPQSCPIIVIVLDQPVRFVTTFD